MSFNELAPEQRQAALEKAKETRMARAAVRADLKNGRISPAEAMDRVDDSVVGRIKVSTFICSIPGFGAAKAEKVMAGLGIMKNRRRARRAPARVPFGAAAIDRPSSSAISASEIEESNRGLVS